MTTTVTVWGVPVSILFQHVLRFYREEKEHIRLEYRERIQLLALFKQVKLGQYSSVKDTDTGYFDVVGADRRKAWKALGTTSQEDAQAAVVQLLEGAGPKMKEVVLNRVQETERQQQAEQSHSESKRGAENGYNGEEREIHFKSLSPDSSLARHSDSPVSAPSPTIPSTALEQQQHRSLHHNVLAPAALWCSPKSARNFIAQVRSASADGSSAIPLTLTLAPGEAVSVQVPTSSQAAAIFWEFVTDRGDIGFGLSFQRNLGSKVQEGNSETKQRYSEQLLPVTLRDCSEDLILGSHQYQDEGVYLLDFVNSDPTTAKVVYYRVFYQTTVS